jgi:hypothetical protein
VFVLQSTTVAKTITLSLKHDHVRRLRALIARGIANPIAELELRLLQQNLYGRQDEIVRVEQKIKPAAADDPEG